jgi:hypothetical protein
MLHTNVPGSGGASTHCPAAFLTCWTHSMTQHSHSMVWVVSSVGAAADYHEDVRVAFSSKCFALLQQVC